MDIKKTATGNEVEVTLTKQECDTISLAARLARADPPPGFDTPLHLSYLELLSSHFKVLGVLISAHVNMCDPDIADHIAHLNESTILGPTIVQ